MRGRTKCLECGADELKYKDVVKIGTRRICKECYKQNKKDHREFTRSMRIAGKYADRNFKSNGFNLNWDEQQTLFKLFTNSGMDEEKAKKRIKSLKGYEKRLFKEIKDEATSKQELNKRFKKEFKELTK